MSNNDKLMGSIEAKLFQIESMAKIALDNHNYKLAGYDEPFINNQAMAITKLIQGDASSVAPLKEKYIDYALGAVCDLIECSNNTLNNDIDSLRGSK